MKYAYDIGDPIRHCLGHLRPPLEVLTSRQHLTRRGFRRSLRCLQNIYTDPFPIDKKSHNFGVQTYENLPDKACSEDNWTSSDR